MDSTKSCILSDIHYVVCTDQLVNVIFDKCEKIKATRMWPMMIYTEQFEEMKYGSQTTMWR